MISPVLFFERREIPWAERVTRLRGPLTALCKLPKIPRKHNLRRCYLGALRKRSFSTKLPLIFYPYFYFYTKCFSVNRERERDYIFWRERLEVVKRSFPSLRRAFGEQEMRSKQVQLLRLDFFIFPRVFEPILFRGGRLICCISSILMHFFQ